MFPFDRQSHVSRGIVATKSQKLSAEQQQRDVFETHRHRVFSISYYMSASELEAEGILTETFMRVFAAPALPGARPPDAATVDLALLAELERRFSLAPEAAAIPDPGATLPRGQVRRTELEESVGTLPARERLVFLLRDVEGYDAGRIGGLLGCDELEVQKTLVSARIRMRNALAALRREDQRASQQADAAMLDRVAVGQ